DGVDRLVRESEGASLKTDGTASAAQREGDARPAVTGIGDVTIGGNQGFGPRHECYARGVPVERAGVVRECGERSAEGGSPRPGTQQQELGRRGTEGRVVDVRLGAGP